MKIEREEARKARSPFQRVIRRETKWGDWEEGKGVSQNSKKEKTADDQ